MSLEFDVHLTDDMKAALLDEQARGADGSDIGHIEIDTPETGRTFPRAAGKPAEFICGCTTEVPPVVKSLIQQARAALPRTDYTPRSTHRDTVRYIAGRDGL